MNYLDLAPIRRVRGTVRLPGSKSISNRILLLAALADGETLHPRPAGFRRHARACSRRLRALGVDLEDEGRARSARARRGRRISGEAAELFLGNAGTAFRPLTAVLALCGGEYRLSGVPRMHERPIGDLVDALRRLGAGIDYLGEEGYPPLAIRPAAIRAGGTVSVRGDVSSQFLTALLMALPLTGREDHREVEGELISKPYVEITLNTMRRFGVDVEREAGVVHDPRGARYRQPGRDIRRGRRFLGVLFSRGGRDRGSGGGPVRVEGVGRNSIQGDVRFAEALRAHGRAVDDGRELDRGGRRCGGGEARKAEGDRRRLQPHSRRGDDGRRSPRCSRTAPARCATSAAGA